MRRLVKCASPPSSILTAWINFSKNLNLPYSTIRFVRTFCYQVLCLFASDSYLFLTHRLWQGAPSDRSPTESGVCLMWNIWMRIIKNSENNKKNVGIWLGRYYFQWKNNSINHFFFSWKGFVFFLFYYQLIRLHNCKFFQGIENYLFW